MTQFAGSWRPRTLATLLAGTMCLTSGCSLFNPHLEPSVPLQTYGKSMPTDAQLATMPASEQNALLKAAIQPTPTDEQLAAMTAEQKKAVLLALLKPEFAGGVGPAIDRVNAWREAYYDAVGEQSMMKNGIALAVIPAAAVAGYFGLTGGSRDVIAGLATGAAGLLGLGVFFESENRQQIYLNGYRAMGCLLFASAPLLMPKTQYDALQSDVRELDTDLGELEDALALTRAAAEALRAEEDKNALLLEADTEIAATKQLVLKAEEAQTGGIGLISRITQAGLIIETAAGNIAAEVSSQIVDDEPRLSALTEITGGIPGTAERVARIPPAKKKPEEAPGPETHGLEATLEGALRDRLTELREIRERVTGKARRLQLTINQYAEVTQSLQNIKGCGFETIDLGLKIQPNETSIELKTGESKSILISGGKRPYSAALSGQVPEGVTLTRSGFDQQPVVAVVTAGTKTGEFDLAIQDASGNGGTLIHFTIIPTSEAATGGGGGGSNSGGDAGSRGGSGGNNTAGGGDTNVASEDEAERNIRQHRVAQYAVGLRGADVDGDIREITRDKVREYQRDHGFEPNGKIDNALYNKLVTEVDADWANARPLLGCELENTLNVFECTLLNKGVLEQLQEKLGVPKTGILDPATRTAIEGSSHEPDDRPPDRKALSFGLTRAILGL